VKGKTMADNYHKTGTILYSLALFVVFCSTLFAQGQILAKWTFDEGSGDTVHDTHGCSTGSFSTQLGGGRRSRFWIRCSQPMP